ncbi:ABC transporter substrate-binding protein [Streptomyces sp. NPDC093149]|uniref:ABC transporter substrate-binding protein n=1 Tax=Streptomyces sp. NPDC093149 TaxID=3366031 RepID=UPI0037F7296F
MTSSPSRRTVLGAALGAASAAVLAGCSGGRPADGGTAVRFLGPETPETFRAVVRGFERANPDLRIDYTPVPPDQLGDVLQLRLSAKDDAIDVYAVDQPRVPALSARGFLTDLTPIAGRARAAVTHEQYGVSSWQGRLRSLPIRTSTQYLFCNADLLTRAGGPRDLPAAPVLPRDPARTRRGRPDGRARLVGHLPADPRDLVVDADMEAVAEEIVARIVRASRRD